MSVKTMADMKPGEKGRILALHGSGNIKYRLIDMGLVKGTDFEIIKVAPLADPIEIKVRNFELSLRVSEAATIDVEV